MKTRTILLMIFCFGLSIPTQGQLLKKLKKRAEQAAERTILRKTDEKVSQKTGEVIDDATKKRGKADKNEDDTISNDTESSEGENTALELHTDAKQAFYKEDVVIKLHENGSLNQTQYFDQDAVAVKIDDHKIPDPGFIDSEGFIYAFQDGEYQKSSIVALQSQGMMQTMLVEAYKLPPEPFMAQLEKQHDQGMTAIPFNGIVEFAFIYKPDDFRYEDFKETKQTQRGKSFTKFEFLNEPGYEGSYVLFDDKDRLVEIYTKKAETTGGQNAYEMGNMLPPGESLLVYDYKPVDVTLPKAREVRVQGQGMMEMMMGSIKKDKNTEASDDDYDTSNSKGQVKSIRTAMENHKVTAADLPDVYEFDWFFETEMIMTNKKAEKMDMNFLIKEGVNYKGVHVVDPNGKGSTTMLFDADLQTMIMFTEAQGQKLLQMFPIPEVKTDAAAKNDFNISKLPSKTIIGYTCKGLQMEDGRYIIKMYHTAGAPIKMGNFMSFSGSKQMKLPDIDPRLLEQFSNGLIMEMEIIDKKKAKNNMVITAKRLNKKATSIKKSGYKTMDLFGASNMFRE